MLERIQTRGVTPVNWSRRPFTWPRAQARSRLPGSFWLAALGSMLGAINFTSRRSTSLCSQGMSRRRHCCASGGLIQPLRMFLARPLRGSRRNGRHKDTPAAERDQYKPRVRPEVDRRPGVSGESQDRRTYRGNRVAVAFGDGSLIATAAHCVDDFSEARQKAILAKPLVFSPYHGDVFEAEIVAVDASADLAILRVAWNEHPALSLADDQELQAAKEMLVAGYAPPERRTPPAAGPEATVGRAIAVVQITVSNGAHRVILGGARFIGPGWSGSPMILTASGLLGGIFLQEG